MLLGCFRANSRPVIAVAGGRLRVILHQEDDSKGIASFNASEPWWPAGLGIPTSAGSQNDFAYAYFPAHDRLAIRTGADVAVYDTTGRQLTGFGQQQPGGAVEIQTTEGPVTLDRLRAVG